MKARVRAHNLTEEYRRSLDKAARDYFDARVEEYAMRLQGAFAQRWLAATLLAASDQHGFGAKRGKALIDGIIEIIAGNCDDVYDRNEIDQPGTDKAFAAMAQELRERGIHLVIEVSGGEVRAEVSEKRKEP